MGEEGRLGVVQGAPARKGEGSLMRRKRGDRSSMGRSPRTNWSLRTHARKTRELSENGRNQGGGGPSNWGERATTVGGGWGAGSASEGGAGAWVATHLLAPPESNHRDGEVPAEKRRREG